MAALEVLVYNYTHMIALIVAKSTNNCIGKNGTIPWNLPEDLAFFKKITTGHTVIMGRKTWESLPPKYRPLPNRKNIVITTQKEYVVPEGVDIMHNISEIPNLYPKTKRFIIGGAQIYKETLAFADTLYITEVHMQVDHCDTFFPDIDMLPWKVVAQDEKEHFSIITYKRK